MAIHLKLIHNDGRLINEETKHSSFICLFDGFEADFVLPGISYIRRVTISKRGDKVWLDSFEKKFEIESEGRLDLPMGRVLEIKITEDRRRQ